jgi:hypothetical protein
VSYNDCIIEEKKSESSDEYEENDVKSYDENPTVNNA